ncbi:MAG: phage tail protein [Chloroflexota bacterium]
MATRETDPLLSYQFAIEINTPFQTSGYFTEVGNMVDEFEVVEHKVVDPSSREVRQMIPGRPTPSQITLKRGVTADMSFWQWRELVVQGDTETARTAVSLTMFDRNYTPIARWDFEAAWPSKVSSPDMRSDSNDFYVEEMTVVFENMQRVS